MFVTIWQYTVRAERQDDFELFYGPEGDWVKLFRAFQGYLETMLWRDPFSQDRYLTIDCWEDEAAYAAFRAGAGEAYSMLDAAGDRMLITERFLGAYARTHTENNW